MEWPHTHCKEPLERKLLNRHTCVSVWYTAKNLSLSHSHTHTHTHTRSHPLGPSEKHARLLLGNPLHTGASILTLNTCICVFGVLPFILLTVKLNFQNSSAHAEEDGSGKKGGDE